MKRLVSPLIALAFVSVGFIWGALSIAKQIFPYKIVEAVARSTGVAPQKWVDVLPRTGRTSSHLSSLGYLHATVEANTDAMGVTLYDEQRAYPGLNLYNEWEGDFVRLVDMRGSIVHQWKYSHPADNLHHAELLPNGDLLLTQKDYELVKIDKDSKVLWRREMRAHHDLSVNPDGTLWVLSRDVGVVPEYHPQHRAMYDVITRLTAEGELIEEFSLLDVLLESDYRFLLPEPPPQVEALEPGWGLDILHANHIEELDGSLADVSPLFAKGNLLLSVKHINSIMILDGATHEILWLWGPTNVSMQHHPQLLDGGRILLFDNGFEQSRVLEIEPPTGRIRWIYEDPSFFSEWGGANQRLPNGNTLITESTPGYAFEVTPEGEKVWEFANPHLIEDSRKRVNIWRMKRFDPADLPFLN